MADDHGTITFSKETLEGFRTNELTNLRDAADQARVTLKAFQGANKLLPGGDNYQPAVDLKTRFNEAANALLTELNTAYTLSDKMMVQLMNTSAAMSNIEDENTELTAQQLQSIIGSALATGGKGSSGSGTNSGGTSGNNSGQTNPEGQSTP
ncbi:hypothetical protein ACIBK8_18750 [Streptomyces sp. NPDC050161]|uniref:hypothetical protein n=1 Tax=Streptomyces sp. NPDC050161 TaxID=3365604 RepID=UPI003788A286